MAKLPDGWVFIPMMKDAITIEIKKMELVTCRHCKWFHKAFENEGRCIKHDNDYRDPDWFCADGEEEDAEM